MKRNSKMKRKGFTLIELLAVIVVLAIVLAIAVPTITNIFSSSIRAAFESDAKLVIKTLGYRKLENDSFDPVSITKSNLTTQTGLGSDNYSLIRVKKINEEYKVTIVGAGKWAGLVAYGTFLNMNVANVEDYDLTPPTITITGPNPAKGIVGVNYTDAGAVAVDANDGNVTVTSVIRNSSNEIVTDVSTLSPGTYTITYTASDGNDNVTEVTKTINVVEVYSVAKGMNVPEVVSGMTPVKWDGTTWVTTTENDVDWYNYTTADKKWANARTADGSMWVWIPRYVYRINSGWHSDVTGTIDAQFSMVYDDTRKGAVALTNTGAASDSNAKWTSHPAFNFGGTNLTGIWVAKFEASNTTATPKFVPNVSSLRNVTFSNMFSSARSMETNSAYGWGTTGTGIDTHMMKNIEWGAIAYLSKSTYGQGTNEIWINNSSTYTTGCAGASISAGSVSGCPNAYNTTTGGYASSTGNIYGIYDLRGGASEATAGYVNNGKSNLTTYGSNLINANANYKEAYSYVVGNDGGHPNYLLTSSRKGDAFYETSLQGNGAYSWYYDASNFAYDTQPFIIRGGNQTDTTVAGIFNFSYVTGDINTSVSYRTVLLVAPSL